MTMGCVRNSEKTGLFRKKEVSLHEKQGTLQQTARGTAKWACVRLKIEEQVEPDEQDVEAPDDCQGDYLVWTATGDLNVQLKHQQIRQNCSVKPPGLCVVS